MYSKVKGLSLECDFALRIPFVSFLSKRLGSEAILDFGMRVLHSEVNCKDPRL